MKVIVAILAVTCMMAGCAELKEAGRSIGHGTRDAAKAIGHGTKRVVNETANKIEEATD